MVRIDYVSQDRFKAISNSFGHDFVGGVAQTNRTGVTQTDRTKVLHRIRVLVLGMRVTTIDFHSFKDWPWFKNWREAKVMSLPTVSHAS